MGRFERIKYPDGQISAKKNAWVPNIDNFLIKERINSYEDLFYIRSIADAFSLEDDSVAYRLFIPCMFGQRSDRRFDERQSFDLKLIAEVINACKFGRVEIFDPHSDVTLALINNSVKVSSFDYVKKAIEDYHARNAAEHNGSEDPILIAPDAGAYKKVFDYGEKLGLAVMAAVKHRDLDGTVELKFTGDVSGKECFIIDDLCDGGYTFITLADQLRKRGAKRVYLYISHGIFSKGLAPLFAKIDHIYTTNSVKDLDLMGTFNFTFDDGAMASIQTKEFVTQYKII